MNRILKILFVGLIVKPVVLALLGLNVRHWQKLPKTGPAILAANHNSHLDTMVLLSLYPLFQVHKIRPVAAADYFLSNPVIAWFSLNVIGIIPLSRSGAVKKDLFDSCHEALDNGDILVVFPEGSRGEPEKASKLKKGIYYIIKDRPETKVIPVVAHGLGRALPRGEALFVPFNCDVVVGDELSSVSSSRELVTQIQSSYDKLLDQCLTYRKQT